MDTRGLTLRKKRKDRPTISAPQNASGPGITRPSRQQNKSGATLDVPRDRSAPSETSDLVKRRYSTRYNQLPDFSNIGAPPVPTLPSALKRRSGGGSPRRPGTGSSSRPLLVDSDTLSDPNLQPEPYVTDLLSNASESDIQEYQTNLQRLKNRNSTELQQSVYQNRTSFIKISKEAEKLKAEMAILQSLMSELTSTIGQGSTGSSNNTLSPELGHSSSQARRNANRTSVANLEQMWNVQLQALWKNIEKSQKFLPAVPGRHIVAETGNWIELDNATWKPKRPIHIVLLNDHLLIASKKRKRVDPNVPQQGPAPTKLVAEECWPLQDIEIVDMAASLANGASNPAEEKAIASALTIRSGARSLTYRHEKREEKAKTGLLMALRKATEDVRKATKTQEEQNNTQSESLNYFAARDPASATNTEIFESINSAKDKPDILIEVDGKQQNFRWVEGQIDDLDIDISMQLFDEAVGKVERLRKIAHGLNNNSIAHELIAVKVDERAAKLAAVLCRELVESPSFMEATKRTTSYLIRLGFEDRAREIYLNARSETLTKRARQCIFDGDLHRYVFSISYVYFTVVKNTVLIYQASFAPTTISACIKWANTHLETFNVLLVRQLSAIEKEGKLWRECMDVVWSHEKEMLGDFGLNFREVIGRSLEVKDISGLTPGNGAAEKRDQSRSKSRVRGNA
ncbi:exocyst complex component exo84 [Exophiala xenobiotica]|uniref:Exocyst complex component EXO84 n=1 Tax=Vermiconidia calcicola TaxID=1690605 RepID=A0AAV9QD22_9PEZI|nr:exocyst complex component exo84 [Exophiala xenobiotica]KAK5530279.1 exocyst complex component exo84 [Chaetothyriales sp. CCFEE 6169]KAK5539559.1 exocyst complex component exo84 [Vermiconidia calcicola]KAK5275012.1 exocyst complex component exo84 [Exophiala xenobiotica]KAK5303823.1 exocyst complex component exo84 [Exophiala xenobiotica]